MVRFFKVLVVWSAEIFRSRRDLLLENLALRQQLAVFQQRSPRPKLHGLDRFFWVAIRCWWSEWRRCLIMVSPETVVRWHRMGFRLYWKWLSHDRCRVGRKPVGREVRELIFRMVAENSTWGAPRIHGEILKLGIGVSEKTVSRWMQRIPRNPERSQGWKVFLENHREAMAAMDFFTVPTLTFSVLYCFFVIAHDRRRILHFNVTRYPTSLWITQQLREAFPYEANYKYLILDGDGKFGEAVKEVIGGMGLKARKISFRSPWQNGIAERWVGGCRRDLLDHVIALNDRHLKRLIREYVDYFHQDRTHLGLEKDTPMGRRSALAGHSSRVQSFPRVGGLHHRYEVAA